MIVFSGLMVLDLHQSEDARRLTQWGCAAGVLTSLAHGMWISLDCRLTNRPARAWRFGALLLGPLIIWTYLLTAYRVRALWMIPLSLLIYLAPFCLVVLELVLRTGPVIGRA